MYSEVNMSVLLLCLCLMEEVASISVQVEGSVGMSVRVGPQQRAASEHLLLQLQRVHRAHNVTAAPLLYCTYQYPDTRQLHSLLSHMMNQLTKVFVRANDLILSPEARRHMNSTLDTQRARARLEQYTSEEKHDDRRFHIVYEKHKQFFEKIYSNMTQEYNSFYNSTVERVDRARLGADPCRHQQEIKQIWRELLQHSLSTLRRAAQRCVRAYLEEQNVPYNSPAARRIHKFLNAELTKMNSNQLLMLCDVYQLCFNDLLRR